MDILILLIILILIVILGWVGYWFFLWQKKIKKETKEVKEITEDVFLKLRGKIEKEIEFLDNTPGLSEQEKKIRDNLYRALSEAESVIKKELKDVEKTVE